MPTDADREMAREGCPGCCTVQRLRHYGVTECRECARVAALIARAREEGEKKGREVVCELAEKFMPWDVADRFTEGYPDSAEGKEIQEAVRDAAHFGLRYHAAHPRGIDEER